MVVTIDNSGNKSESESWRWAMAHALPAAALVLGLFYYWFAVADRYIVFLYYHHLVMMGTVVLDTSPFSAVTSGRYWMAGLVASGAVLVIHTAASWLLGRLKRDYRPPAWWRILVVCAVPLAAGIPLITMTVNHPTLPAANAARAALAALIGLALALLPGRMAAERPRGLAFLASDGLALALVLLLVGSLEHVFRLLARGSLLYLLVAAAGLLVGLAWLLAMTGLYLWRRQPPPGVTGLFLAGAIAAYLLMPLAHYTVGTDGYFYITTADNFFANNFALQILAWLVGGGVAFGITRLRRRLHRRRAPEQTEAAESGMQLAS
jgi:hypothetical protein